MSWFESKPYPSSLLQPKTLQDNVLQYSVDVAVSLLDGTVNIQRGCARRLVHGRNPGLCGLRGVYDAAPHASALDIRDRRAMCPKSCTTPLACTPFSFRVRPPPAFFAPPHE
jgi:hypothetical protein